MEPLLLRMDNVIKKDFILLNVKHTAKELLHIINNEAPKKVFLLEGDSITFLKALPNSDRFLRIPAEKLSIENYNPTKIMKRLKNNEVILIYSKKEYIGYLHQSDVLQKLIPAYRKLHAYFQTMLDTINESCIAIDQKKDVMIWTKAAKEIFSLDKEQIIGKQITDFFSLERLEAINTLEKGTSVRHHQHHAREDLVVLINSNPVYIDDEIVGAVVSETDVTSQVRLNNELFNTREKLFSLEKEVNKLLPNDPFQTIRGNSPKLKQTIELTKKAISTKSNILITGESGVGKELFAKAIHKAREGEQAPFIAINCGAIPSSLFESEIFGYEKGAFSGADQRGKKGKAELAQAGTLFLDEIGEMPLDMQVKILRLIEEKMFYAVGGTKEKEVDFNIIAATNRNLEELVKEGKFREDLYYRLNVVSIEIPPLRKRQEDIIELTHYFLYEISIKYNRPIHGISQSIMQALLKHQWQGNIRELRNVIERLVVFSEDGKLKLEHLPFETDEIISLDTVTNNNEGGPLQDRLQELEKEIIIKELKKTNGNKLACAKNLQITRATLYNRMNKLGIEM